MSIGTCFEAVNAAARERGERGSLVVGRAASAIDEAALGILLDQEAEGIALGPGLEVRGLHVEMVVDDDLGAGVRAREAAEDRRGAAGLDEIGFAAERPHEVAGGLGAAADLRLMAAARAHRRMLDQRAQARAKPGLGLGGIVIEMRRLELGRGHGGGV